MPSGAGTSHPGHSEGRKVVLACGWGRLWRGLVNAVCRGWTGWLPRGGVQVEWAAPGLFRKGRQAGSALHFLVLSTHQESLSDCSRGKT